MARGEDITETLRKALGVPYVWGGTTMNGFDCSGLVQWAFAQHGISLPRVTYNQINVGASVSPNKLRPGDLVFFDTDRKKSGPDHVGVYLGGGKFIHAPRPGANVKISSLAEGYYMDRWMGGRRISGVSASATSGGGQAEEVAPRLDAHHEVLVARVPGVAGQVRGALHAREGAGVPAARRVGQRRAAPGGVALLRIPRGLPGGLLRGADVDHGGADPVHQLGEIRQPLRLRQRDRRHEGQGKRPATREKHRVKHGADPKKAAVNDGAGRGQAHIRHVGVASATQPGPAMM